MNKNAELLPEISKIARMCVYLTTPGNFISATRYSGAPTGGPTSKVTSGLQNEIEMRVELRAKCNVNVVKKNIRAKEITTKEGQGKT